MEDSVGPAAPGVFWPHGASQPPAPQSKRPDYMTPPPPRRMLDEQSLRALLDARSPLCAPPRREGWATPPFAQPALPAIGPGPAPPPPGAPAEGDRGAVGWRGPPRVSPSPADNGPCRTPTAASTLTLPKVTTL